MAWFLASPPVAAEVELRVAATGAEKALCACAGF